MAKSSLHDWVIDLCQSYKMQPDERRATLRDLAAASDIEYTTLSKCLNGRRKFGYHQIKEIVRTFARWGALTTQAQANELLRLAGYPPFGRGEWQEPSLADLKADHEPTAYVPPAQTQTVAALYAAESPPQPLQAVGRRADLDHLHDTLAQHHSVAVTGMAGMGKTWLAALYYHEQPAQVKRYWHTLTPQTTIRELVSGFFVAIGQAALLQRLPLGAMRYDQQVEVLLYWLREHRDFPCLIILNNCEALLDQHNYFVDDGFDWLLDGLISDSGGANVIFTSRFLPRTTLDREPAEFRLGGLDEVAGAILLGNEQVAEAEEVRRSASRQVGGHPLTLALLAQMVRKGGNLDELIAAQSWWREEVVTRLFASFYKQLPKREQQLLQYIAVFKPRPANALLLAGMLANLPQPPLGWSQQVVEQVAHRLQLKSLLDIGVKGYELHPLVADYCYAQLTAAQHYHLAAAQHLRAQAHRALEIMPQQLPTLTPLLTAFDHLTTAGEIQQAYLLLHATPVEHLRDGSGLALLDLLERWGEYTRLVEMNRTLVNAADQLARDAERCAALSALGLAEHRIGEAQAAEAHQQQALRLAEASGNLQAQATCWTRLGMTAMRRGDITQALDYHEQALATAEAHGYARIMAANLGYLGAAHGAFGDYRKSVAYSDRALALVRQSGDQQAVATYLANLGLAHHHLGAYRQALGYLQESLTVAGQIGFVEDISIIFGSVAMVHTALGEYAKALEYHRQALAVSQSLRDLPAVGGDLNNIGYVYELLGDYEQAIIHYQQALVIAERLGNQRAIGNRLGNLASAYRELGQRKAAQEYNQRARRVADELNHPPALRLAISNQGNLYADSGEYDEAISCYQQALAIATAAGDVYNQGRALGNLGLAYYRRGSIEEGIEYTVQAIEAARRSGNHRNEGECWHNMGQMHLALNNRRVAAACFITAQPLREATEDPRRDETSRALETLMVQVGAERWIRLREEAERLTASEGWWLVTSTT